MSKQPQTTTAPTIEQFADEFDELKSLVSELRKENAELRERVDDLEDEKADLHNRCEQLEDENEQLQERVEQLEDKSTNHRKALQRNLVDLRNRLETSNPTPEAGNAESAQTTQADTALEQVVALPEQLVESELTTNQERARFVAKDIKEYAKKAPAGWVIDSATLRRVLRAAFDAGHTETVDRVRSILDNLGGTDVDIVEKKGSKKIVFATHLVNRLNLLKSDHSAVIEAEG